MVTVTLCRTCNTHAFYYCESDGHHVETVRLLHRSRRSGNNTETQWSSDWEREETR